MSRTAGTKRVTNSSTKHPAIYGPQVAKAWSLNLCTYIGLKDLWETARTGLSWDQRRATWERDHPGQPYRIP